MDILTLYDCSLKRLRLGSENDGGYVIFDGLSYDGFISGGIDTNMSFESDFLDTYKLSRCYAFDNSIDTLPNEDARIVFCKREISKDFNLSNYIDGRESCFVKMDIEGSEWDWLESLSESTMKKIKQLVIECHFLYQVSDNVKKDTNMMYNEFLRRMNILKKVNNTHVLCHIHANNYAQRLKYMNNELPTVFECTYVNKNVFKDDSNVLVFKNIRLLPTKYDSPNCDELEDINTTLNYEPFVHSDFELITC